MLHLVHSQSHPTLIQIRIWRRCKAQTDRGRLISGSPHWLLVKSSPNYSPVVSELRWAVAENLINPMAQPTELHPAMANPSLSSLVHIRALNYMKNKMRSSSLLSRHQRLYIHMWTLTVRMASKLSLSHLHCGVIIRRRLHLGINLALMGHQVCQLKRQVHSTVLCFTSHCFSRVPSIILISAQLRPPFKS